MGKVTRLVALASTAGLLSATALHAQTFPPDEGGLVTSLGQPPILKWSTGLELGGYYADDLNDFITRLDLGLYKDLMNPVAGLMGVGLEGYVGTRGSDVDGGARAMFVSPFLGLSGGIDFNFRDVSGRAIFRFKAPLQRGGFPSRGSMFQLTWVWGTSLTAGFSVPLFQPNIGKTRPDRTHFQLDAPPSEPIPYSPISALEEPLDNVRETSSWVNRLTTPFIDQGGFTKGNAREDFHRAISGLRAHMDSIEPLLPDGRTSEGYVRAYHAELTRAFSIAADGVELRMGESTVLGERVTDRAKLIVLDEVIFPYNRLLGVKKSSQTIEEFAARARGLFATWLLADSGVLRDRQDAVVYVFEQWLEDIELNRSYSSDQWGDSRLVWIPLQYALLPEQHDTRAELDDIVQRAIGMEFTEGNRIWYVMNAQFQVELAHAVERAENYHVLWIHDIEALNGEGDPDGVTFRQVVDVYLGTMLRRIREYDATGKLPVYMIFMDQYYYELKKSRMWLTVLEDPLHHRLELPQEFVHMQDELDAVQAELRQAVADSRLLQEHVRLYGDEWLRNRVKVHVNITNPADETYWTNQIIPVLSWPDDLMRDHRKLSFYDITEEDPYRGMAVFGGMGIGEHYVGAHWEDRGIMIQGPGALPIKKAARDLLINQGFAEHEIPWPLRPKPKPADYDEIVQLTAATDWSAAPAMQLHNETGYHKKEINVAKATLYSLMPPGSVIIIPDSLWNNDLWAALLLGNCLRGARVFLIAPSVENAPGGKGFPQMSRAHELFARVIIVQDSLGDHIARAGGMLKTGLYDTPLDVADVPGRATAVLEGFRATPWLEDLFAFDPSVYATFERADEIVGEDFKVEHISQERSWSGRPNMHLKIEFFATKEAWDLVRDPGLSDWLRAYGEQRAYLVEHPSQYKDVRVLWENVVEAARPLVESHVQGQSPDARSRTASYLMVGSSNQDYRSMIMDGEVAILTHDHGALHGLMDFIFLVGVSTWVDDEETLETLLPEYSGFKWWLSRVMKDAI